MPYRIKKSGSGYKVVSPNHPGGFSKEPQSKEQALAQQRALYANSKDEAIGGTSRRRKR